jgi:hypothetical protein
MKWTYNKEINRMGEVTQTLINQSTDIPVADTYQPPTLILKKDRFGFGIKFCLGGLELKGGYKIQTYYTRGLYYTFEEHYRLVNTDGVKKYRFRFDEGQPQEDTIDFYSTADDEFKVKNDFFFSLKESKKLTIELETLHYGKQWYDFDLEGLTELCDEHKIFQYKRPTPIEHYVPSTEKSWWSSISYWWILLGVAFIIWFVSFSYANSREIKTTQTSSNEIHYDSTLRYSLYYVDYDIRTIVNLSYNPPPREELTGMITRSLEKTTYRSLIEKVCVYENDKKQIEIRVDYMISLNQPSEYFYYDTYTHAIQNVKKEKQKVEVKKKVRVSKKEKIVKEENDYNDDEYVKPIEVTPTYNENEREMIQYLKSKFPNYSEEQIGRIVKSNKEYTKYNDDIPTYVVSSVRRKKTENNDSNAIVKNNDKLNVNDYPTQQVKKKGFLKRLFSRN